MANKTDKKDRARTGSPAHYEAASNDEREIVPTVRKGKKTPPWQDDAEVLFRLETVSEMMLRGKTNHAIAAVTGTSASTVRRDRKRVRELWNDHSLRHIEENMARTVATLRLVQREAFSMWFDQDASDIVRLRNPKYLEIILKAENQVADVQGTKRFEVEHTTAADEVLGRVLDMNDDEILASLETVTTVRLEKKVVPPKQVETIILPDDAVKEV